MKLLDSFCTGLAQGLGTTLAILGTVGIYYLATGVNLLTASVAFLGKCFG